MNVLFSFKQLRTLLAMLAMMIFSFPDAVADAPSLIIKDLGEGHCLVQINTNQRYLLLPVEEGSVQIQCQQLDLCHSHRLLFWFCWYHCTTVWGGFPEGKGGRGAVLPPGRGFFLDRRRVGPARWFPARSRAGDPGFL